MGAGELLDRAVTLFVRQFVPIAIVLAVVIVPLLAFQAILSPHSARVFSDMSRILSSAGDAAASREAAKALSLDNSMGGSLALIFFVGIVARLLMWSAIVTVIATAYAGSRATFAQAYRIGVARWLPQIVVAFGFAVLGVVAALPLLILYVVVVIAVAALAALQQVAAAIAVGIAAGLVVLAAFAVVGSWVFMAYELAAVAVVTETTNPITAIGLALRRGLARGMRRRMIVGGLVVFAVSEGGTLPLLALAALVTAVTHVDALYFAIIGAGTVLLEGLIAAFVVVYAVDVRVRREGLDIVVAEPPPVPA